MLEIKFSYGQFLDLMISGWPFWNEFDADAQQRRMRFRDWLETEWSAKLIEDQNGNWQGLRFRDKSKASEFVLRYG